MPSPTQETLNNATVDLQKIAEVATANPSATVTMRQGGEVKTIGKAVNDVEQAGMDALGDFLEARDAVQGYAADGAASAASAADSAHLATEAGSRYDSDADALSNGVDGYTGLVAGSGGTNGQFNLGFSGGAGSGAAGYFVVAGGVVTDVRITARGKNYTSAPTISFAASSGLTGASATALISINVPSGKYFSVVKASPDTKAYEIKRNDSGVATLVNDQPSAAGVQPAVDFGETLALSITDMPDDYPEYVECIEDVNGDLRIMRLLHGTVWSDFTKPDDSVMTEYAKLADLGIESTVDMPDDYPLECHVVADDDGNCRLISSRTPSGYLNFGEGAQESEGGATIPLVFDVFGLGPEQSNGVGTSPGPGVTVEAGTALCFNPYTGTLTGLADPLPTAGGYYSMWPAFAKEYNRRTGRGVVLVPAYEGGTALSYGAAGAIKQASGEYWGPTPEGVTPSSTLTPRLIARLHAAIAKLDADGYCWQLGGLVAVIGETEAQQGIDAGLTDKQDCKDSFTWSINLVRADFGNDFKVFVVRTGSVWAGAGIGDGNVRNDTAGFQAVREAQDELCRELPNVVMAFTGAYNFPKNGRMRDSVHYNQQGLNDVGKSLAAVAAAHIGSN